MLFHAHHHQSHDHTHGVTDPHLLSTQRGIWAITWSFWGLLATAFLQGVIVFFSGSIALFADTLHNLGDALTALPLLLAFLLARRPATHRFTYGYGRVEDLAGVLLVAIIFVSAFVVGYEAIQGFPHPAPVQYLPAVALAAFIGFVGNELIARLRIKVGQDIGSAALVADGYHARADGLTSLLVLVSAGGIWFGYPLADPLVGLFIALVILRMAWVAGKPVFLRLLDAVDPQVVEEMQDAASRTPGVAEVTEVRVRWIGHRLHAELNVAVDADLTIVQAHDIAKEVRHTLLHQLQYLSNATIHLDPLTASGDAHHRIANHAHDELPSHSH
ncbi:MAG: cation diffusion facilitator family transporter [Nitrospirales bacterium]